MTKDLHELTYKKNRATCTNNVEQYEYKVIDSKTDVATKVEILIQKIRDVSTCTQYLKIYKKLDGKWVEKLPSKRESEHHEHSRKHKEKTKERKIRVNHEICYAHGANISTLFEGHYLYYF